ncbi:MAG: hypothetical protein Kow0089_24510 [Desulfobulbaceae bacterium]
MPLIRQTYYFLVGLSFPIFWAYHMDGFMGYLYSPLQHALGVSGTGLLSFLSASCLYTGNILFFEFLYTRIFRTGADMELVSPELEKELALALKKAEEMKKNGSQTSAARQHAKRPVTASVETPRNSRPDIVA